MLPVFTFSRFIELHLNFIEIPPPDWEDMQSIILYDRDVSVRNIISSLMRVSDHFETPFMDSFGTGKTTLAYRFRSISDLWETKPRGYDHLQSAIYLHISCKEFVEELQGVTNFNHTNAVDAFVMKLVHITLCKSCGVDLKLDTSLFSDFTASLTRALKRSKNDVRFLFHFDDVEIFERMLLSKSSFAKKVLCRLWAMSFELQWNGHFCIISGCSKLLQSVQCIPDTSIWLSSRSSASMISLPPLSEHSARAVLSKHGCLLSTQDQQELITFSGGIPSAISVAVDVLNKLPHNTNTALTDAKEAIRRKLKMSYNPADEELLYNLLMLTWGELYFKETYTIGSERVTTIVARLGLYAVYHPMRCRHFRIVIPLFLLPRDILSTTIHAIANYPHGAERLELGMRRAFYIRCCLFLSTNWQDAGIPYLDQLMFPFRKSLFAIVFLFPKEYYKVWM